ncbi:FAD-dependent oxidoreductase [Actinacidiphila bryophytorum]|uniref:Pyridine nucleotide-disulphide oxidoreductase n=1 Tax=Actinacidiphila bryophytorum TaxID=1436133 RepID=A0A9W4MGZ0_9ACTN|nr:FAD-dependent oxidoreductase [Actinacidiphila bryophytorum]MBM9437072.1 FAD-dependent oxidoreductase [Actinacidiphila bryophytorum]MBN6544168.1 FAD-dependent oxidoreductase [Actinacidiphila bryophytorum]CAG7646498.1 Pyridine nucleotide-disulphide oxidoreductase [Actinacidiphila bryophytorum]
MNEQIVVIGGGAAGTLAANRLRTALGDDHRIVVVDRVDPRDRELDLLVSLGVYGPGSLQPPDSLRLRDGIGRRLAEAAGIDTGRKEVCLTDGTTVAYRVLVLATGRHRLPPTTDGHLTIAAAGLPWTSRADVYAVVPGRGGRWPAVERPALSQVEHVVAGVLRYLDGPAAVDGDNANTGAG